MANLIVTFKLLFANRKIRMLRQGSLQDRLKSRGTSLFQVDHDHDPDVFGDDYADECSDEDNCDDDIRNTDNLSVIRIRKITKVMMMMLKIRMPMRLN